MKNEKRESQSKALVFASLVVLFWSTVATAFKIGLSETGVVHLLFVASLTALAVCFFVLLFQKKLHLAGEIFKNGKMLAKAALHGFLNPFAYYLVLFKAYSLLPAQIAQPLNCSWQVVLILMMALFYKQKISIFQGVGVLVSFIGILLLSSNNSADISGKLSTTGVALALGSAFIWAAYWISKMNDKADSVPALLLNFLFGSFYLLIVILFSPAEIYSWKALASGVYIGCFEMGFTFILWAKALQYAQNRVSITQITYLAPFLSLILIHFILGENIGYLTILGLLFVIGGILLGSAVKIKT